MTNGTMEPYSSAHGSAGMNALVLAMDVRPEPFTRQATGKHQRQAGAAVSRHAVQRTRSSAGNHPCTVHRARMGRALTRGFLTRGAGRG